MNQKTYHNVTQDEMEGILHPLGFERIDHTPGIKEIVYGKRVDTDGLCLTVCVFSGINPDGQSRECGKDAIRVTLFVRDDDGHVSKVSGDKRVNRIQTWEKNLRLRINKWTELLPPERCPECGAPMVPRTSKFGDFLGCCRYPKCQCKKNDKKW